MKTIKAFVYINPWTTVDSLKSGKQTPVLSLGGRSEYYESEDYSLIGEADVNIEFYDADTIREQQLEALKGALQRERAATEVRQNAILESISKLQAIEYHA